MLKFLEDTTAQELASILDANLVGPDKPISGIEGIETAQATDMCFLAEENLISNYASKLAQTKAGLIILPPALADKLPEGASAIVTKQPKAALGIILKQCCKPEYNFADAGVHSSAVIGKDSQVDKSASIGPNVVIGDNVEIGANCKIMANVVIGDNVSIGPNTVVFSNVVIYREAKIGTNCKIQSNSTIGSEGFGYNNNNGVWEYLPHLSSVTIGNNVQIGANTSIDRGFLTDTVIGDGCIIDNQNQIGHNVRIGKNVAIAGCSAIAGSAKIGDYCMLGGGTRVAGHLEIESGTILSGTTAVNRSITKPGVYSSGMHAKPRELWQKNIARFYMLDNLFKKVRGLEKSIKTMVQKNEKTKEAVDG